MKKLFAILLTAAMVLGLTACGSSNSAAPAAEGGEAAQSFEVGIVQLVEHPALDAATKGFRDAISEAMGDSVTFNEQNAAGDSATCSVIASGFVSDGVDLILANATPALQAAAAATNSIPVLGTSITEYGVALDIENFSGTVGTNISGTSDLPPLDQQAEIIFEFFPETKNVGIVYCSAEANSVYQAKVVDEYLTAKGVTVTIYTFADSNDVASVVQTACDENDVLYIPTDNTAASCTEAINNVARPAGIPIICGEEGICKGCGVATLSIDYYELGRTTGEMAVKILKGESKVEEMPIEYYPNPVKKYNAEICEALGITVPEGYEAIAD